MSSPSSVPSEPGELPFAEWLVPHDGSWEPDGDHDTVRFDAGVVRDVNAPGTRFLDCAFTGTALEGGSLRRARLINVWSQELRLVGTDLAESQWQDTALLQAGQAELPRCRPHRCDAPSRSRRDALEPGFRPWGRRWGPFRCEPG